jgi:hypothetical protein
LHKDIDVSETGSFEIHIETVDDGVAEGTVGAAARTEEGPYGLRGGLGSCGAGE